MSRRRLRDQLTEAEAIDGTTWMLEEADTGSRSLPEAEARALRAHPNLCLNEGVLTWSALQLIASGTGSRNRPGTRAPSPGLRYQGAGHSEQIPGSGSVRRTSRR
ncbi:hypothetical protein Stube_27150 [Streptomyces tubercidicus]|uniref:Uncharacterized protein n=1 Tax=Streptomyces tubercidicus TaxID=47759 RepID=A0A640URQ7_9ACTN|nr:hypothetical protein Stube_27150 [Streptomyces tubercidicus]